MEGACGVSSSLSVELARIIHGDRRLHVELEELRDRVPELEDPAELREVALELASLCDRAIEAAHEADDASSRATAYVGAKLSRVIAERDALVASARAREGRE